jgi:hypothetical protein
VTRALEPGTSVLEPILMAPEDGAACAVRRLVPRVRIVGGVWAGCWVKVAVVPSKIMAFEALESVWPSSVITEVALLRSWLPICRMSLECWVAVIVVEPRSRMASGRLVSVADVEPSCEVDIVVEGLTVSPSSALDEYV